MRRYEVFRLEDFLHASINIECASRYFTADPDKNWSLLVKEFLHCSPHLVSAIEKDKPSDSWQADTCDSWKTGGLSEDTAATFSRMMDVIHGTASELIAKNVNFHEQFGIKSMMDVGGGSGCYR